MTLPWGLGANKRHTYTFTVKTYAKQQAGIIPSNLAKNFANLHKSSKSFYRKGIDAKHGPSE
jgi:hypothetical protein